MTDAAQGELRSALGDGPLAERFDLLAEPFLARRAKDDALARLDVRRRRGLARVLATRIEAGRYLAHRPGWLERLATSSDDALGRRAAELEAAPPRAAADLEAFLDELRLLRRDETLYAACLDLGELHPFDEVSHFLSRVAEVCVAAALDGAQARGTGGALAVLGMGKIAGRELTYESDLDMIFLHGDETAEGAARTAARTISYLSTMTGAGVAYAVDARLRPSGRQGALVTAFDAFGQYQRERAATWEHLALLRSRPIAGAREEAREVLDRTREIILSKKESPWAEVASMRRRVERERGGGSERRLAFKTGAGGLMDVEFLATAGLLERGRPLPPEALPAIASMLRAAAPGEGAERLLRGYRFLRRVEARNRWVAGRALESLSLEGPHAAAVAELVEPGLDPSGLGSRLREVRREIRSDWDRVIEAGSIGALG
jgi:glutamate-ammonia-ligase adenylyltransferase